MSDAEFSATAAEDKKAKDRIKRHTTAEMLGITFGLCSAGTTRTTGRSACQDVGSDTAESRSRHGLPSTVGVAIAHVRTRGLADAGHAPRWQLPANSGHQGRPPMSGFVCTPYLHQDCVEHEVSTSAVSRVRPYVRRTSRTPMYRYSASLRSNATPLVCNHLQATFPSPDWQSPQKVDTTRLMATAKGGHDSFDGNWKKWTRLV